MELGHATRGCFAASVDNRFGLNNQQLYILALHCNCCARKSVTKLIEG